MGKHTALIKACMLALVQPSAASESHMKIQIQGPMFCTKVLRLSDDHTDQNFAMSEGVVQSRVYLDSLGHHFDENVFCLLIIERRKRDHSLVCIERVGLLLARPKREKEDYIRIGVWLQSVYPKDERESTVINSKEDSKITKEEDLALNAEDKTIFLI